ncbi:unnamed protein product [Cuscuta campestris]|uniref:Putative plant transposon protein domain-containing protein n=1 Tax=Cuscuta campestris TaxID=132261 RepID=A0A484KKP2_9ASTE|nr:unnamed protein product [Cuscuta campestris]
MASRTKKRTSRPSTQATHPGSSSQPPTSNENQRFEFALNPRIFFDSEEALNFYRDNVLPRKIITPRYVDLDDFERDTSYEPVLSKLRSSRLINVVTIHESHISVNHIKAFYSDMTFKRRNHQYVIISKFCGKEVTISSGELNEMFGMENSNKELTTQNNDQNPWYNFDEQKCWEVMNFRPKFNESGRPKVNGMQPPQRLIQYISSYILCGRSGNHPQMSKDDAMLIYAILKPVYINWGKYILTYMNLCRAKKKSLLYPMLLTYLLKRKGFEFAKAEMESETPFWRIKRPAVMRTKLDGDDEEREEIGTSQSRVASRGDKDFAFFYNHKLQQFFATERGGQEEPEMEEQIYEIPWYIREPERGGQEEPCLASSRQNLGWKRLDLRGRGIWKGRRQEEP